MSGPEFKIRSSGKECLECRKRFQVGEAFYSLLRLEGERAEREDRCGECWEKFRPPGDCIWWRTRRREEKGGKKRLDFESIQALFFQVLEDPRPEVTGLRYVTALLLVRKKKLKLLGTVLGEEGEVLRLSLPGGEGKILEVPVPPLDDQALETLKNQLKEALTLED